MSQTLPKSFVTELDDCSSSSERQRHDRGYEQAPTFSCADMREM